MVVWLVLICAVWWVSSFRLLLMGRFLVLCFVCYDLGFGGLCGLFGCLLVVRCLARCVVGFLDFAGFGLVFGVTLWVAPLWVYGVVSFVMGLGVVLDCAGCLCPFRRLACLYSCLSCVFGVP